MVRVDRIRLGVPASLGTLGGETTNEFAGSCPVRWLASATPGPSTRPRLTTSSTVCNAVGASAALTSIMISGSCWNASGTETFARCRWRRLRTSLDCTGPEPDGCNIRDEVCASDVQVVPRDRAASRIGVVPGTGRVKPITAFGVIDRFH